MKKLVVGVTAPGSVMLLEGQLKYFTSLGYQTYLITQEDEKARLFCEKEGCIFLPIAIRRDISIVSDLSALIQIFLHFQRVKPDIINVGTSKMGFLGTIAGFFTNVPLRIYTARGLRYETEKGLKRIVLMGVLKIVGLLAHRIICISEAIRVKAVANKLFPAHKTRVIHKGSSNGIDLEKFTPTAELKSEAEQLRQTLGIADSFVFGFVGRINDRKGINELYSAFTKLAANHPVKLLIVGPVEMGNLANKQIFENIKNHPSIVYVGFQANVPLYLSMMDVFVLPTWSEGFGNVFIQAAAMSVPVIGTRVSGVQNAVSDGFNGMLTNLKDVEDLYDKMSLLYQDSQIRNSLATNGRPWAMNFDRQVIWEGQHLIYEEKK